jgi:hypothetical protein
LVLFLVIDIAEDTADSEDTTEPPRGGGEEPLFNDIS